MSDATFACPDLTTFCRLDELGLEVVLTEIKNRGTRNVLILVCDGLKGAIGFGFCGGAGPTTPSSLG